tara:strand:- start:151 stop:606 length:456 start_codon:yes stop_codon:yes gene_type:complete
MKNTIFTIFVIISIIGCQESNTINGYYGNTDWDQNSYISGKELMIALEGKDSLFTCVKGNISAACQVKGCWMSMDVDGNEMLVKFKDYGFFVPKNSVNHEAIISGWAYSDTITVSELIEIAKDENATEEEIAQIASPEVRLQFMANGVVIN